MFSLICLLIWLAMMAALAVYQTRRILTAPTYLGAYFGLIYIIPVIGYRVILPEPISDSATLIGCLYFGAYYGAFVIGYCATAAPERVGSGASLILPQKRCLWLVGCMYLVGAGCLFAIAMKSGEEMFSRRLYEVTRIGFGPLFFGGQAAITVGLAISFLQVRRPVFWLSLAVGFILLLGFGSKGCFLNALVIGALLNGTRMKVGLKGVIGSSLVALIGLVAIAFIFWLFSPWARDDLLFSFFSYADTFRNFTILIDTWDDFRLGILGLEDNIYTLVPRWIVPEKPALFGSGVMSDAYFKHRSFDEGAPSFTEFGRFWADFGYIGLPVVTVIAIFKGVVARRCEVVLARHADILALTIYCACVGVGFIVPGGFPIVIAMVNIYCGYLLRKILAHRKENELRNNWRAKEATGLA